MSILSHFVVVLFIFYMHLVHASSAPCGAVGPMCIRSTLRLWRKKCIADDIFPNYFFSISSALGAEILTEIFDNFCSAVVVAAPEHHVDGELRSSTSMYYAWTRAMSFFKSTTETWVRPSYVVKLWKFSAHAPWRYTLSSDNKELLSALSQSV